MPTTRLTGTLIKSGSIPVTALGGGVVSSSGQVTNLVPAGTVSSSTQVQTLLPAGTISSSTQINVVLDLDTVVSSSGQVKELLPTGTVSSSAQYPGWVTASSQIDYNSITNKLSGVVSSSAQVQPLLPGGTVSSSAQYPGWVTASSQIDYNSITNKLSGVVSSSTQVQPLLPANTVSSSGQVDITATTGYTTFSSSLATIDAGQTTRIDNLASLTSSYAINSTIQNQLAGVASSSAQVKAYLPGGSVSSSAQYPGWVTASSQIDYNSITNKLSGVVSSSTQVQPLLPGGTVSSSGQVDYNSITNKLSGVYSSSTQAVAAIAGQTIAPSIINATGAISGASIQASGNGTIGGNLTVSGTITATSQSIQYISSSQFNVATNKIIINTDNALRFGGISVVDSGSAGKSGSLYWDSLNDRWLYEDVTGGTYNSAIIVAGPQNTGATGAERGLLIGRVPVASGDDHIDTAAASSSIRVDFPSRLTHIEAGAFITGNLTANGTVTLQGIYSSSGQVDYNSITNKLSGVYSSSAFTTVNQGTLRLSLNGVALSDVDTGLQTTDGPTFAGMVSTAIISGSGASYRLVVPVGTNYYAT